MKVSSNTLSRFAVPLLPGPQFDYFDIDKRAEPFEPVALGGGGADAGGRWSPDASLGTLGPAVRDRFASDGTAFLSRDGLRDMKAGRGTTDYVEMIKRMAAQKREPPGVERG